MGPIESAAGIAMENQHLAGRGLRLAATVPTDLFARGVIPRLELMRSRFGFAHRR